MLEFLELTGNYYITDNPTKFCFLRWKVMFIGFQKLEDSFAHALSTVNAIMDVCGWLCLVDQVSFTFSKTKDIQLFNNLFSERDQFTWNQELQDGQADHNRHSDSMLLVLPARETNDTGDILEQGMLLVHRSAEGLPFFHGVST